VEPEKMEACEYLDNKVAPSFSVQMPAEALPNPWGMTMMQRLAASHFLCEAHRVGGGVFAEHK